MSTYIKRRIVEGEHQQQDFKFAINDSRKIARSLVAFANTQGGRLLIGVKDNGAIAGVRSEEEYYMVDAAARLYSKPEIRFETRHHVAEGKTVLEIIIPAGEAKPYYAQNESGQWVAFVRSADQNLPANTVMIKVWKSINKDRAVYIRYTEKEKILLDYLTENRTISLSKFCRLAYISRHRAEDILVNLIVLNIINIHFSTQGVRYSLHAENTETSDS